ncbi:creatininase family protein [Nesterenkonia sphaerica]|uniref:Creatininase family protein n=1 Tax=Nesterenkonia sphaerica TaxID=1804988 RepID=A0A5R9AMP2_9MICC|nr:creatininase family protein [Nesterenkonia sphaerica]TLP79882.1 creatininase family protein [Nesterenkonia sphaerica]
MSVDYHRMTTVDAQDFCASDGIVIVPIGATEQHGPHLPLGTDFTMAETVAQRAAQDVENVVVTPAIWTGYSPHHMEYTGTVSLRSETLMAMIRDVAESLWHHGFRRILFLNGHGGNMNLLGAAAQTLRFELDVRITVASYWSFASDAIANWRKSPLGGINHACEMETSLMLTSHGDQVKPEQATNTPITFANPYLSNDLLGSGAVATPWDFAEVTADGTLGHPELATAERGRELLEAVVRGLVGFLEDFKRWDWQNPQTIVGRNDAR